MEQVKEQVTEGPVLRVHSLMNDLSHLLSEKAVVALEKKSNHQIAVEDVDGQKKFYKALYCSLPVLRKNFYKALPILAEKINALVEKDLVHSFLAGPSYIELLADGLEHRVALFFFPLVDIEREGESALILGPMVQEEGSLGPSFEEIQEKP